MPKPTKGPRIGGSPAHERIILANMASQLFEHGKITTTETRAKRVQPLAERLISKAKRGDLASRRRVAQKITDKSVVHTLFTVIAPAVANREGGYTRVTKIGPRKGDNAPMAIIEIVTEPVKQATKAKKAAKPEARASKPGDKFPTEEEGLKDKAEESTKAPEAEDAPQAEPKDELPTQDEADTQA